MDGDDAYYNALTGRSLMRIQFWTSADRPLVTKYETLYSGLPLKQIPGDLQN